MYVLVSLRQIINFLFIDLFLVSLSLFTDVELFKPRAVACRWINLQITNPKWLSNLNM